MSDKVYVLEFCQIKWFLIFGYLAAFTFDSMLKLSFDIYFAPSLTVLLLLFWTSQLTCKTHLFTAFLIGIFTDTAMNTPLGSHALIFILLVFFMLRIRLSFKSYPAWQQAITIGLYLTFAQVLSWVIFEPVLPNSQLISFWLVPWVSAILWPFLYKTMLTLSHRAMFD